MKKLLLIAVFVMVGAAAFAEPVKIIFDTDMLTDYDDAGALACLHALADAGECEILATVSCTRGNSSVATCEAINAYYGRPDIPVGCTREIGFVGQGDKSADGNGHAKFRMVRDKYAKWVRHPDSAKSPDALEVYRKVLSEQPDGSVVICSVGFLSNMRRIVEAEPALVAKKVKLWVAMACKYPKGSEYNSSMDAESSAIALEKWPTPIVFSDFDYGRWVFAGRRLVESKDRTGPVKDVFAMTLPPREECSEKTYDRPEGHPSWDETAVIFAVRGAGEVFGLERGTYRMTGKGGENEWIPGANGRHQRLTEKMSKKDVGALIDELMCRPPRKLDAAALAIQDVGLSRQAVPADAAEWPVLKTYDGEHLRRIKMPMGGIGTGTFSLAGNGGLVDWAIFNTPAIGNTPTANDVSSGFLIRTEDADGRVAARLMEGPVDTSHYDGGEGCRIPNHAFPRFRECTFKVAYPLAQVELKDESMPVTARLEAMNPLVTNNAAASGIPAVLLRWNVRNVTAKPVKVSVMGMLVNPTGGGPFEDKDGKKIDIVGTSSEGLSGVSILNGAPDACDNTCGSVLMAVPEAAGVVTRATRISDSGWMVRFDRYWKQFVATGKASNFSDPDAGLWTLPMGTVAVQVELAPNETKAIPFVVAWRYPHRPCWSGRGYRDTPIRGAFDPKRDVGNFYATQYPQAVAAAAALWKDLPELEQKTVAFVDGVLAAKAPEVVKEAALFNLSTLRCETCWRSADGHFYGWEGIFETGGSCFGSCTHVWGYEHALVDLWPELARDMTELQFERQMGEDGHIAFRIQLPLSAGKASNHIAAADGQLQCIIKAYENWKKDGGDAWLKRLWTKIRKAVEFCWVPGGWDADVDGVMEGCQHNTMDVEYYGPNPQMEFLYLAALKAAAAMADAQGDAAFAKKCRGLYVIGSAWTESNLFNGEWYEHKVVPPKGALAKWISHGAARDLKDPDYQLAAGCLVDQLLGDYAARHVGLGAVADEKNANKTLDTILAKNASANVGPAYNCGRDYAMSDEPALKMAWYPEGRMPKKPFPYYGENMTGFEYVVAANLAQRGRFAEAEKVVRDIRNRYDGRKRNPFDEAECGHHYSRALDAWSVLKAFDRQNQHQTKGTK